MIAALAMMRGMLGKPGAGLLPLRGHSNVQGMGSVGVVPKLKEKVFANLEEHFGVRLPTEPGLDTMASIERAATGDIDAALCLGGNLFGSNPDAAFASAALRKIGLLVHLSTTLNTGHACGLGKETIILPVKARDEEEQSTTQESMFNYIRLSDGGPARHDGPRSEVDVIAALAEHLAPTAPIDWQAMRDHGSIRTAIAAIVPGFEAIGSIGDSKQEFVVENRVFHEPTFSTESGRAKFFANPIPKTDLHEDEILLMTIRSEGQFNTVVYEEEDLYRGQERRDVILMHQEDMAARGIHEDGVVVVTSEVDEMEVRARSFDIAKGCAAMYYPEVNRIVPRSVDPKSRTPSFKAVRILIEAVAPVG
jgi:anaerobic selenocysteine-containing dehydrogenase